MAIQWNKNGSRWTNGKLKIKLGSRSYSEEVKGGRTFRPFNATIYEIYHRYEDGFYIGQEKTLDDAKEKMEEHKKRKK